MKGVYEFDASATPPSPPATPSVGYPSNGNPGTGTPATEPGAWFFHMLVAELTNIITAGGVTPDHLTLTQVKQALDALYAPKGMRNLLINANFAINQRGYVSAAATTIANQYTLDRWRVVTSGQNLAFAASGNGNQVTAPAGGLEQVIEGINIAGGTYVLSWTGTATATVNGTATANGGTIALPANTNATVRFIGGTVSKAQLEPGTVPSSFEQRPIGFELSLCQRYFELRQTFSSFYASGAGQTPYPMVAYKVSKRVNPTVTFSGITVANGTFNGAGYNVDFVRPSASASAAGMVDVTATFSADAEL